VIWANIEVVIVVQSCHYDFNLQDRSHANEPDCAVLQALEPAEVDAKRHENFLMLEEGGRLLPTDLRREAQAGQVLGRFIRTAKKDLTKNLYARAA